MLDVEVLLSTYNAAGYLPDLIDSIRSQTYTRVHLRIRDDGSTDGTASVVSSLRSDPLVCEVSLGQNVGAAKSFFLLMGAARQHGTRLVALCDQDDVWLPEKIARGVAALSGIREPALYCGAVLVTDQSLQPLWLHRRTSMAPSFANALVENIATGSTIMLNAAALELACHWIPRNAVMHDAWLYLLISGAGVVIYDDQPLLFYRQHPGNTIGVRTGISDWRSRLVRHTRDGGRRVLTSQGAELREHYANKLTKVADRQLADFLDSARSPGYRFRYVVRGAAHRQRHIDDLVFRVLYVLGRI